jgi:type VI secretion system secreted protein Hcp
MAAADIFIKIGQIKGESKDEKHKDEIQVLSWSWGLSNAGSFSYGGGGGSGKASFSDLNFMKHTDAASPDIFLTCANGKHHDKATLTVRKAGENPVEYLIITMEDVLISSMQCSGSEGTGIATESVSLNFAKVKFKYTPQDAKGKAATPDEKTWDIAGNVKG